jgi:transposase InsO family protein
MMQLGRVSRASFYRFDESTHTSQDADMDLRDAIQRIALEWPSYGRPRITAELRRRGWKVNPKRVYRILQEDNLLYIRKRKFVVTTDSNHGRKIYPNLARTMVLTGVDQLWVADITYIRAARGIRLFSRHPRRLLTTRNRLGFGSELGRTVDADSAEDGIVAAQRAAGPRSSFGPWFAVRQQRLHGLAQTKRNRREHVAQRQSRG